MCIPVYTYKESEYHNKSRLIKSSEQARVDIQFNKEKAIFEIKFEILASDSKKNIFISMGDIGKAIAVYFKHKDYSYECPSKSHIKNIHAINGVKKDYNKPTFFTASINSLIDETPKQKNEFTKFGWRLNHFSELPTTSIKKQKLGNIFLQFKPAHYGGFQFDKNFIGVTLREYTKDIKKPEGQQWQTSEDIYANVKLSVTCKQVKAFSFTNYLNNHEVPKNGIIREPKYPMW